MKGLWSICAPCRSERNPKGPPMLIFLESQRGPRPQLALKPANRFPLAFVPLTYPAAAPAQTGI